MLRPHLADGADLLSLVKYRTTHVTAYLGLRGPLDRPQICQQLPPKLRTIGPGVRQLAVIGFEADTESLHRPQLQLLEPLHDVGHALSAPSIAAKSAGQLPAVGGGKHARGEIPDGLKGLPYNSGSAQEEAVGIEKLLPYLSSVGSNHIVSAHVDLPSGANPFSNGLRQLSGVAIGTDIGNNDRGTRIGVDDSGPLLISLQHPGNVTVQHRAMAGADHVQGQRLYTAQGVQHERLVRPDDAVIVILGGPEIALVIRHLTGQDTIAGVVGAEGVTGNQDLVLPDIGVHGIRPVKVGHHHELQGLSIQLQSLAVPDRDGVEVPVNNLLKKTNGAAGGYNLDPWIELQQPLHAAAVVRLRVADHQVVHLIDGSDLPHLFKPAVQALNLGGLKEHRMPAGFQNIGVVGGTKLRVHDDVEHPEVMIQGSGKIKTRFQFQNSHS